VQIDRNFTLWTPREGACFKERFAHTGPGAVILLP
jgi:hypothetical protein